MFNSHCTKSLFLCSGWVKAWYWNETRQFWHVRTSTDYQLSTDLLGHHKVLFKSPLMFSALSVVLSNQLTWWSQHAVIGVTWEAPYCFTAPVSIWFLGSGNFLLAYAMCELKPLLLPCLFFTVLQPIYFACPKLDYLMQSVYSPKTERYVENVDLK